MWRKKQTVFLILVIIALAFRLSVAYFLANDDPDDGRVYAQIARNLLEQHSYSINSEPPYEPTLIRLPGYPLFLAGIYSIFGHLNNTAVRLVQALFDTATCVLIAALAFNWGVDERRRRASLIALTLAAVCPFTAIYVATILTETLTIFFGMAATLAATFAFKAQSRRAATIWWIATGLLAGAATLCRPDGGLFAAAIGLTLLVRVLFQHKSQAEDQTHARDLARRFARSLIYATVFSLAFALALTPWAIRNARVFHRFQPLAPAHAEMPGEFVARGYNRWLRTWVDDERYVPTLEWTLDDKPIKIGDIPDYAFDSAEERARVVALLDKYNHPPQEEEEAEPSAPESTEQAPQGSQTEAQKSESEASPSDQNQEPSDMGASEDENENDESENGAANDQQQAQNEESQSVEMTPEIDAGFAQIARERIARAPLRYYLWLPAKRAAALWFDTHSQFYPFEGELFPLSDLDYEMHQHLWLPLFAALTWLYTLLGLAGAWSLWRAGELELRLWLVLVVLMTLPRLAFMSTLENPEPRYVVELFPFLSILGGIAASRFNGKASKKSRS